MKPALQLLTADALATIHLTGAAPPAKAHAELESSDPPARDVLTRVPARVVLRFEGPISPIIPSGGFRRWFDGCKVWLAFGSSYTARVSPRTYAQLFRIVATAEAISWAGLLTGMYFKYLTDAGDLGVRIFGPIHGGIFVAYVLITFLVSRALGWGRWTTLVGLACSVPPFATLAFEVWAQRSGQLMTPTTGSPDEPLPSRATTGGRV